MSSTASLLDVLQRLDSADATMRLGTTRRGGREDRKYRPRLTELLTYLVPLQGYPN